MTKEFKTLRKELVGESCKDLKKEKEKYKEILKEDPNNKYFYHNPNIREKLLETFSYTGYDMNDIGVDYLSKLIMLYIHERKLFKEKGEEYSNYWDLDQKDNPHYNMLGTNPKKAKELMERCIKNNKETAETLSQLVYEEADHYGFFGLDRFDSKRKSYTLSLVYNKKSTK